MLIASFILLILITVEYYRIPIYWQLLARKTLLDSIVPDHECKSYRRIYRHLYNATRWRNRVVRKRGQFLRIFWFFNI